MARAVDDELAPSAWEHAKLVADHVGHPCSIERRADGYDWLRCVEHDVELGAVQPCGLSRSPTAKRAAPGPRLRTRLALSRLLTRKGAV
jgi:hypothetical protein